jgi:hypothetical protein
MPWKAIRIVRRLLCVPLALALAAGPVAYADPCCDECCQRSHCPPPFFHCMEGPPKIKYKCGCPRPVCPPCELQHWGYYETCWRAWPFPPDWSHCPTPPAAAQVPMPGPGVPVVGEPPRATLPGPGPAPVSPGSQLPMPKRIPSGL